MPAATLDRDLVGLLGFGDTGGYDPDDDMQDSSHRISESQLLRCFRV